jgi:alkylation response protein AidB-like acyl-CoA dehydrogenase
MALAILDRAIQAFGAEGVSQDQYLAETWARLRTLRLADVSAYSTLSRMYLVTNLL